MSTQLVKPGEVLGKKYRVERVIGVGGMGMVVAARHIDLNQRVALKFMLREAMADPSHAERFLREAKAAVQLKSVHTTRVLDVGRLKNDEPYMVMEYLEGRDLDAELHARGPMPPRVAVDFVLQAAEALAEAHGLGMVHRDVKLKNLFLTKTVDGQPLVKVLDFGLAKQLGSHGDVSLTATNSVFGSPQYMSPEQMRSAKDVDHRTDIWSLGVCLYELLTGRVPFDAGGVAEICAMVLKDPVTPPSQLIAGIPFDLESVVMQCLDKDVSRRPQSIADLAFALQSYARDEGSARRILHVMQSAQLDSPTELAPSQHFDDGAKTINAWNSNLPGVRPTQSLSRQHMIAAVSVFAALGVLGSAGVVLYAKYKRANPTTIAGEAAGVSVSGDPSPPPPPETALAAPPQPPPPSASAEPETAPTGPETVTSSSPPPKPGGHISRPPVVKPPAPVTSTKPKKKGPGEGADYM